MFVSVDLYKIKIHHQFGFQVLSVARNVLVLQLCIIFYFMSVSKNSTCINELNFS